MVESDWYTSTLVVFSVLIVLVTGHLVVVVYTLEADVSTRHRGKIKYLHHSGHDLVEGTRLNWCWGGRSDAFGADCRCHGLIDC